MGILQIGQHIDHPPPDAAQVKALRAAVDGFDDKAIAALNYVDGCRSVTLIAQLVSGEWGDFDATTAAVWFDLLAQHSIITWSEQ